jgi:hypothetical protein
LAKKENREDGFKSTMQVDRDCSNGVAVGPTSGDSYDVAASNNSSRVTQSMSSHDRIAESIYEHIVSSVCIDFASNMHQSLKTGQNFHLMPSLAQAEGTPTVKQRSISEENIIAFEDAVSHTRQQLYPQLYDKMSKKEVMDVLRKYAVDVPNDTTQIRKRSILSLGSYAATPTYGDVENDDDDERKVKDHTKKKRKIGDENDEDDEDYQLEEEKDDDEAEHPPSSNVLSNTENKISSKISCTETTAPMSSGETTNGAKSAIQMDIWGNHPSKEPTNITCRCRLCGRHVSTSRFASHLDKCMGLSTRPLAGSTAKS